ncbi:ATP-binding protein [Streptomyces sp. B6B3]|uniref:ATP-binding protein n=1 Tax=Streptomyces sp. B6B3 TaxID=3153570 RepID=UPI00325D27E0
MASPAQSAALFAWTFPREPPSVALARAFVSDVLPHVPCVRCNEELRQTVVLLVSEVTTNAVRHGAGSHFLVECQVPDPTRLTVTVHDDGPGLPCPRVATAEDEGGRGLALLDLLADEWRYEHRGPGKAVAFTVTAPTLRSRKCAVRVTALP